MCGIFGFITDKPSVDNVDLFKNMCFVSSIRGTDATGMAWILGKEIKIHKKAVEAWKYIEEEVPRYEAELAKAHVVIGHTRKWTQGKPEDNANNHPIISDNWTMVHNGTCSFMDRIKDYKYKGEVDSEILLSYVEKHGIEEGLSNLRGCAAIAAISKEDNRSVYLWRHDNPMWIALDRNTKTIFFGSTDDIMLEGLRNELCFFTTFQIRKVPEDILYKIHYSELAVEELDEIELKKRPVYRFKGTGGTTDTEKTEWKWDIGKQLLIPVGTGTQTTLPAVVEIAHKYYFAPRPSMDFFNWEKHDVNGKKWHSSIDGLLVKIWDKAKLTHFLMSTEMALKNGLIENVEGEKK